MEKKFITLISSEEKYLLDFLSHFRLCSASARFSMKYRAVVYTFEFFVETGQGSDSRFVKFYLDRDKKFHYLEG